MGISKLSVDLWGGGLLAGRLLGGLCAALFLTAACSDSSSTTAEPDSLVVKGAGKKAATAQSFRVFEGGGGPGNGSEEIVGNPASVSVGLYAMYISTNADCTNLVTVSEGTTAQYKDFLANPVL